MSIVVGEVIAVSGVRISLRIFEDSSLETIFFEGVKYRGVSLREHLVIQRGFIDIVTCPQSLNHSLLSNVG